MLQLVDSLLDSSSSTPQTVYEQSLKCLCSWVKLGIPLPDIEQILAKVFAALSNEVYFDTAIETLVQVFVHPECDK